MLDIVHKNNDKYAFLAEIDTVVLIDDSAPWRAIRGGRLLKL